MVRRAVGHHQRLGIAERERRHAAEAPAEIRGFAPCSGATAPRYAATGDAGRQGSVRADGEAGDLAREAVTLRLRDGLPGNRKTDEVGPTRREQARAVQDEVVDGRDAGRCLRLVEVPVGLEGTVHHRDRDAGAAAAEKAVEGCAHGAHHGLPQYERVAVQAGSAPSRR